MISVLIPAYNAAAHLGEAIESVLAQTFQDIEIIVVDDGSTDDTRRVAESYSGKILYQYQENSGAGASRNRCIELSRGEFLAFLDADDIWSPEKLELQMREFAADPSLDAVFGMMKNVLHDDWEESIRRTDIPATELFKGYTQGTMLIKRESFLKVGMFSEEKRLGEFVDWFLRAKEADLRMKILSDLVLWRRIHGSNLGIRQRSELTDYVKILKKSIDRRRGIDQG